MNINRRNASSSARTRITAVAAIVFFLGWLLSGLVGSLVDLSWKWGEWGVGAILFGGTFVGWVLALHFLNKKDPTYVASLLEEISDKDGQELEQSISGSPSVSK